MGCLYAAFLLGVYMARNKRQNTKNPIPSNSLADLNDNTMVIDEFINSSTDATTDRFGKTVRTMAKIQKDVNNMIAGKGFLPTLGGTLTGDLSINTNNIPSLWLKSTATDGITARLFCNHSFGIQTPNQTNGTTTRLRYTPGQNNSNGIISFENVNNVMLNNFPLLKKGDYGLGNGTQQNTSNIDIDTYDFAVGFYSGNNWKASIKGLPFGLTSTTQWFYLLNQNLASMGNNFKLQIIGLNQGNSNRLAYRYKVNGIFQDWQEFVTSKNIKEYFSEEKNQPKSVEFTENGTFIVPTGINKLFISAIGGGGAGGGGLSSMRRGGGGNSGASIYKYPIAVVEGQRLDITIGIGGLKGIPKGITKNVNGGNGGITKISSESFLIRCDGGNGGLGFNETNKIGDIGLRSHVYITKNSQTSVIGSSIDGVIGYQGRLGIHTCATGFFERGSGGRGGDNGGDVTDGINGIVKIEW